MLPNDASRCTGQWSEETPIAQITMLAEQCQDCRRRTDRPAGVLLSFMVPPEGEPCPMRLEGGNADH